MRTIAYLTDLHLGESAPGEHGADAFKNFRRVCADLTLRQVDTLVLGGDLGTFEQYPFVFQSLKPYESLCVTPGNHDTAAQLRQVLPDGAVADAAGYFSAKSDAFFHYLFLDSSKDTIDAAQLEWLQGQLAKSVKPLVVFIHHPILAVDTIIDKKYPLRNRDAVKQMLLASGKPVTVFCGHYHAEDQREEANIRQFLTPAVSYQIQKGTASIEGDATFFGYRMIYLNDGQLETETIILYPDDF